MPRVNLSETKQVLVEIRHVHKRIRKKKKFVMRRATLVRVISQKLDTYTAEAVCSAKDIFCKRTGVQLATQALMESKKFHDDFSKEERETIFKALCPKPAHTSHVTTPPTAVAPETAKKTRIKKVATPAPVEKAAAK